MSATAKKLAIGIAISLVTLVLFEMFIKPSISGSAGLLFPDPTEGF